MEIGEIQEVKHLIVCLSVILALSAVFPFAAEPVFAAALPKIPDAATAITLDGKTVSLADHRGKLIFLTIWRTDCKACLLEIPLLNRLQKEYSTEDFTVIGLSVDRGKNEFVSRVVEKLDISYPVWLSHGQPLSWYTRVQYLPTLLAIGPEGEVLGYMVGAFFSYEHALAVMKDARNLIEERKSAK